MKLLEMTVNNFRCISGEKTSISFKDSDIIFLFGQNNAGKSSMLTAYEYLVTPKQVATINDFCGFCNNKPIEITAIFMKENGDETEFAKKGFNKWVDSEGIIKFRKTWTTIGAEGQKETWDPVEKEFKNNGFGGMESHFKNQAPTPIRISAMTSPDELSKWIADVMKKSILKTLKEEESAAYQNVVDEIKALQDRILSKEAITKLSEKANINFQKIFPDLTLEVNTENGAELDVSKALEKEFSVTIKDPRYEEVSQKVSDHGHGVVRQAMFNFLGLVKQDVPFDSEENGTNKKAFLILYEEPEIYLHPKAIILLRKALYDLCLNSPFQIFCASHSPQLIDISKPHTSLVRMVKNEDRTVSIYQVGDNIFSSTDEIKQQVQMINRFNPHVCESFFADDIVMVEGDTEAIVVRELLDLLAPKKDIFVLNAGTKNNFPFFQKIFTHFNIKHQLIHDGDSQYLYKENKPILNKDGSMRRNSAWELNKTIWTEINTAKSIRENLACRYVSIPNFEVAHNYVYDVVKGKPLSAYEFVKNLDLSNDMPIQTFVKCIAGLQKREIEYTQEELEKLIVD